MEGDVKFFNRKKGFGFIKGDDDKDYFVHFTAVPRGTFLRDNDRVSFDPAEGDRGLKAENVQLLEKGSDRPQPEGTTEESEAPAEEPAEEQTSEESETPAEEPAEEETSEESETPAEEPAEEETEKKEE